MKVVATDRAPAALGPYSQGRIVGNLVYTSGQLGLDLETGNFVSDDVRDQTKAALEHIKNILEAAGSGMEKVFKSLVFLNDMNDFAAMNEVYATFFKEGSYPARSAVEVAKLPKGGLVEIEVIAEL